MKTYIDSFSVLVPDGERPYLRLIANCLSQVTGIKIYIMSDKKNIAMRYSRFVHHFSYYPKTSDITKWIANINTETSKHAIDLILSVFEDGMFNLLKHRNLLTDVNKLIVLPYRESFLTAKK